MVAFRIKYAVPGISGLELRLRYAEARILPAVSYHNAFIEVPLNSQRKVTVERQAISAEWLLEGEDWRQLEEEMAGSGAFVTSGCTALQQEMRRFEQGASGAQPPDLDRSLRPERRMSNA